MWFKWLPWRYIVRRVANSHGFVDPIEILGQLHRFAQPSEVAAPLELLRAGVVFHARGLMNTGAIQHNLDWVWPFWVERQFDPRDDAFIPRAFSITHVNLTHRNWTAVGWPNCDTLPIVDPRGLLTPFWDSWSLDAWIVDRQGQRLFPARAESFEQRVDPSDGLVVESRARQSGMSLTARVDVGLLDERPICRQRLTASCQKGGWLAVVLRPYNPEGVSFLHDIRLNDDRQGWMVNDAEDVWFDAPADRTVFSEYHSGDVASRLAEGARDERRAIRCDVGMATAAALFELEPDRSRSLLVQIPLPPAHDPPVARVQPAALQSWPDALAGSCTVSVPDEWIESLFQTAVRTLILHSPGDVYPGPYTYKRFWFRDAAFILNALLTVGLARRAERVLDSFPGRQNRHGYFLSQDGEWDSNGEALWSLWRYVQLTGQSPKPGWQRSIRKGAQWILDKRLSDQLTEPHAGLLPPGFSAEHLGPNDYYYWDDFWGVAGLRAAAHLLDDLDDEATSRRLREAADRFMASIRRSLEMTAERRDRVALPAAPYRRMDAGAIGSLVCGYPLRLYAPDDPRLLDTAEFLLDHCFVEGAFFQDMIHSGLNPYLTLHVAQVLLRAGDSRHVDLLQSVAGLASPTGQWPEAIHPRTRGGCMGDGQHVWAAAEWVMMVRNCFVREEDDRLILASGLPAEWLEGDRELQLGPTATPWGDIAVTIASEADRIAVRWQADWRGAPPPIEVRLPGHDAETVDGGTSEICFERVVAP